MMQKGAIDEVAALEDPSVTCGKAIGITQIQSYLKGHLGLDECKDQIATATRQYAKRQRTWFGKESWLTPCPVGPDTNFRQLAKDLAQTL